MSVAGSVTSVSGSVTSVSPAPLSETFCVSEMLSETGLVLSVASDTAAVVSGESIGVLPPPELFPPVAERPL